MDSSPVEKIWREDMAAGIEPFRQVFLRQTNRQTIRLGNPPSRPIRPDFRQANRQTIRRVACSLLRRGFERWPERGVAGAIIRQSLPSFFGRALGEAPLPILALLLSLMLSLMLSCLSDPLHAQSLSVAERGEVAYIELNRLLSGQGGKSFIRKLKRAGGSIDWQQVNQEESFRGYLRFIERGEGRENGENGERVYLLRSTEGEVFILTFPDPLKDMTQELRQMTKYKMDYRVKSKVEQVGGLELKFSSFSAEPSRPLIDRLFYLFIVVLLFTVMLGMGLTLTLENFKHVFKKPRAMIVGPICQVGILPFLAMLFGTWSGIGEQYPFVYVGLILVAASPGGVTSNLLTYWGRGDLALSISMTAFSTMLSIFFTPFLLYIYTVQVSDVSLPIGDIASQILTLVLIPLFLGMFIRSRAEKFARCSQSFFSILGVSALLILITTGLLNNPEVLVDFERYGLKFYTVIMGLTLSAMISSLLIAKLLKISNYQTRAISLETGIQNGSLAIAIALLIQDRIGDFYSSTVFTSGLYGIWMYLAGGIMIASFKKILPLNNQNNQNNQKS